MKQLLSSFLLVFVFGFAELCMAEDNTTLKPTDFAYGLVLKGAPNQLYQFTLPAVVYEYSTRQDLSDIRIYNGNNEPIPYSIQAITPTTVIKESEVSFFPIYSTSSDPNTALNLVVFHKPDGDVTMIYNQQNQRVEANALQGYVLDMTDLRNVNSLKLRFDWDTLQANWINNIKLSGSNDLHHWKVIIGDASFASLKHADNSITQNELQLPNTPYRYLFLQWPQQDINFSLRKVMASYTTLTEIPIETMQLPVSKQDATKGTYEYIVPSAIPIQSMMLQLTESNNIVDVRLRSRYQADQAWQTRFEGTVYQLSQEGRTLQSGAIPVNDVNDRYWQLQVNANALKAPPTLLLQWQPAQILFYSRDEGPYILVFGNYQARSLAVNFDDLLAAGRAIHKLSPLPIIVDSLHELSGEKALSPPEPRINQQVLLLWSMLIIAVLMLASMVYNLSKKL